MVMDICRLTARMERGRNSGAQFDCSSKENMLKFEGSVVLRPDRGQDFQSRHSIAKDWKDS